MLETPGILGKVILITGGTGGIGKATAMRLAKLGGTVIIVGRNESRGNAAVADITRESGNDSIQFMAADLSSQQNIRELAKTFVAKFTRLDVLINNVGGPYGQRRETADGIETTLAINHLCPFLLTLLLLPVLRVSAPSRIVNVNSEGHRFTQKIYFEDLQTVGWRRGFLVYSQAKLSNLMFTYELASRLAGERITVNAVHPGMVDTELVRRFLSEKIFPGKKYASRTVSFLVRKLARLAYRFDDLETAAGAVIYLAVCPEVEGITGRYFNNDRQMVQSSPVSYDKAAALRLWRISSELTGYDEAALGSTEVDRCDTGLGLIA
jgi:NAD(P)-dependent dehydrogenase (short-subunit alcohol dehydrogenase family)